MASSTNSLSIESLDDEILAHVLRLALDLPLRSLDGNPRLCSQESLSLPLVCRRWRRVMQKTRESLFCSGDAPTFSSDELEAWLEANPKVSCISLGIPLLTKMLHRWIPIIARSARSLTSLHLYAEGDFSYPDSMGDLTGLKQLSICGSMNRFRSFRDIGPSCQVTLPSSITRLTGLTSLKAMNLQTVPASVLSLPLKTLVLEHCRAPQSLAELTGLESLTLNGCSRLPDLGGLDQLTRLQILSSTDADQLGNLSSLDCEGTLKELVLRPTTGLGDREVHVRRVEGSPLKNWELPEVILRISLPRIETVDLALSYGSKKRLQEADFLASLPSLRSLHLMLDAKCGEDAEEEHGAGDDNDGYVFDPAEIEQGVREQAFLEQVIGRLGSKRSALKGLALVGLESFPRTTEFWDPLFNLQKLELVRCGEIPPQVGSRLLNLQDICLRSCRASFTALANAAQLTRLVVGGKGVLKATTFPGKMASLCDYQPEEGEPVKVNRWVRTLADRGSALVDVRDLSLFLVEHCDNRVLSNAALFGFPDPTSITLVFWENRFPITQCRTPAGSSGGLNHSSTQVSKLRRLVVSCSDSAVGLPVDGRRMRSLEELSLLLLFRPDPSPNRHDADYELQEHLFDLPRLSYFHVGVKKERKLPDMFSKLPSLRKLDILAWDLEELPNCLGRLQSLVAFHLGGWKGTTLPEHFGRELLRLPKLAHLDLNECSELASLPESFVQLVPTLESLSLQALPKLARLVLPKDVGKLSSLDLRACPLLRVERGGKVVEKTRLSSDTSGLVVNLN